MVQTLAKLGSFAFAFKESPYNEIKKMESIYTRGYLLNRKLMQELTEWGGRIESGPRQAQ